MRESNGHSLQTSGDAGGLLWISEWTSLMQGINSALLASFYSDYLSAAKVPGITCSGTTFTPEQLKAFAASQVCFSFKIYCLKQNRSVVFLCSFFFFFFFFFIFFFFFLFFSFELAQQ
jgi:hypothetical protein